MVPNIYQTGMGVAPLYVQAVPTEQNRILISEPKNNSNLATGTLEGLAVLAVGLWFAREGHLGKKVQNLFKGSKKANPNGSVHTPTSSANKKAPTPLQQQSIPKVPQLNPTATIQPQQQQTPKVAINPNNINDLDFLDWKKNGFQSPPITQIQDLPIYTSEAKRVTESFNNTHRIDFLEKIPDGFRDGGRHMIFSDDGTFYNAYREIALVDRKNDIVLQKTIDVFKTRLAQNKTVTDKEKTQELLKYIDEIFSVEPDSSILIKHTENFPRTTVKIGDIINSGAGVCRHRALVAKLIADEIGLPMAIVRGNHGSPTSGAHIWNEINLSNGDSYIFDGMHKTLLNISDLEKRVDYQAFNYCSTQGDKLYFKTNSTIHSIYGHLQKLQENVSKDFKFAEFTKLPGDELLMTGKVQQSNLIVNDVIVNNTPIKLKLGDRVIIHNPTTNDKIEFNIPTCGVKP